MAENTIFYSSYTVWFVDYLKIFLDNIADKYIYKGKIKEKKEEGI